MGLEFIHISKGDPHSVTEPLWVNGSVSDWFPLHVEFVLLSQQFVHVSDGSWQQQTHDSASLPHGDILATRLLSYVRAVMFNSFTEMRLLYKLKTFNILFIVNTKCGELICSCVFRCFRSHERNTDSTHWKYDIRETYILKIAIYAVYSLQTNRCWKFLL